MTDDATILTLIAELYRNLSAATLASASLRPNYRRRLAPTMIRSRSSPRRATMRLALNSEIVHTASALLARYRNVFAFTPVFRCSAMSSGMTSRIDTTFRPFVASVQHVGCVA